MWMLRLRRGLSILRRASKAVGLRRYGPDRFWHRWEKRVYFRNSFPRPVKRERGEPKVGPAGKYQPTEAGASLLKMDFNSDGTF